MTTPPPAHPGPPSPARRGLPRTLRTRLIAGLVGLLILACATLGLATTLALHRFLVDRLDQQLTTGGGRFAASLAHDSDRADPHAGPGDTRGQAVGTFGARLVDGRISRVGVVGAGGAPPLSAADEAFLLRLSAGGPPRDHRLAGLGEYRLLAIADPDGDGSVVITGLPLEGIHATIARLVAIEAVVFAVTIALTGIAGAGWIGLSLRPLRRVAATATRVSQLRLDSGQVVLSERVPDTDPATEVGQLGVAFNRMLGHVEDALVRRHADEERLRQFVADASHELRTPLAAIRGYAELAGHHAAAVPGEVGHALGRIEAESVRLGGLVEDLLLLARLDAGRPLAHKPVDLTRLALDAVADARVAGPGHRWRLELPAEPVVVRGDEHRLRQVLANLLANARSHTPPGTTVTVRLTAPADPADPVGPVELEVDDDGPGIPTELRASLFERFARGDHSRSRASGGAGLGLAIVQAVIAAHHGGIEVTSRPGATTFRIRLPVGG